MASKPRAFTLVEVLVAVSIIALLIAILLPTLGSVRESTRFAECTANMQSFSEAFTSYHRDHSGYMVYSNWDASSPGWLYAVPNGNGWRSPGSFPVYEERAAIRKTGHLYERMNQRDRAYHCPEDEGPLNNNSVPARALSSYQMNGAVNAFGRIPRYTTHPFERMRNDSVFMWETDETRGGGFWNDGANRPDEGLSRRHVDGAPFARIDGSAIKLSQDDFYEMVRETKANALWCNPNAANGRW